MDKLPFVLVIISLFTHAYWNFLLKSSENKHIFIALSKITEVIIFAVPAIYFIVLTDFQVGYVWLILVAAIITFLNYFFLSIAYKYGDLSLVYPVSRSSLLFLPILAYFTIGEKVDRTGIAAIILLLLGTIIMHLDSFNSKAIRAIFTNINNKGSIYALFAACAVAGYTLWGKISISKMDPFLYFYLYTFNIACFYLVYSFSQFSKFEIKQEWDKHKFKILQVGIFNSFTFLLILTALSMSKASYVGGLRQLSIIIVAFLGYKFLGETIGLPKLIGIMISIIGGILIYLAN